MQSERLQNPRLLVFTLGERQESRRRRLLPAAMRSIERRLHRACLEQTLEAGRGAGFAIEVSSPTPLSLAPDIVQRRQDRGTFGGRIASTLRRAFAEGGGPLALVGTDVPGLEARHLRQTRQALAADPSRVVIGPSPDGGFYLLAAAQPLEEVLGEVRWCSRDALRSLRRALERAGRPVVMLPPLADLDERSDLEQWLAGPGRHAHLLGRHWHHLAAQLTQLLAAARRPAADVRRIDLCSPLSTVLWVRGPPRHRLAA